MARVLEHGAELRARVALEVQHARRIELHRQDVLEGRVDQRARVVELAGLEQDPAAGLDEFP